MKHPEIIEKVLCYKMSKDELLAQFDKIFSNDYNKISFLKSIFMVISNAADYIDEYGDEPNFKDMTEDQIKDLFLKDAIDNLFNFDEDMDFFNLLLSISESVYEDVYTDIDNNEKT